MHSSQPKTANATTHLTNTFSAVPMQAIPPDRPDMGHPQQQPPVYHQDPNMQYAQQHPQAQAAPQMYGSPPPQQPHVRMAPPPPAAVALRWLACAPAASSAAHTWASRRLRKLPQQAHAPATPVCRRSSRAALSTRAPRPLLVWAVDPAPADCPACGQRAMTNVSYEVGNTTQYVTPYAKVPEAPILFFFPPHFQPCV